MTALGRFHLVDISVNVPGPAASARLRDLGIKITKVEPPGGDPLERHAADWYRELRAGKDVVTLDLKQAGGRHDLFALLGHADMLLTSHRPAALDRLGLAWNVLHDRFPMLCQVAIVGYPAPRQHLAGHDLMYQSEHGLVNAPSGHDRPAALPRSLLADLHGAEQAASAALAALLAREATAEGTYTEIALAEAAASLAAPLRHDLTTPGGMLGGGYPPYNLYAAADGWIAIAALEPAFWQRFVQAVERPDLADTATATIEAVAALFRKRTTSQWLAIAARYDIPLSRLDPPLGVRGVDLGHPGDHRSGEASTSRP